MGHYEGTTCEIYNACLSHPCMNGASCTKDGRVFRCSCRENYEGRTCEFGRTRQRPTEFEQTVVCRGCSQLRWCSQVHEICDSFPCLNGGECKNEENGYTCSCKGHINGTNCENLGNNLALEGKAYHSTREGWKRANETIDGTVTPVSACFSSAMPSNPWWRVELTKLIEVNAVDVLPGRLSNVKVEVGPYYTEYQTCRTLSILREKHYTPVLCRHSLRGYGVKITLIGRGILSLCQVAVYGTHVHESCDSWPCLNGGECKNKENGYTCMCKGRINGTNCENAGKNWAIDGRAFQLSGSHYDGAASKAIDGNTDAIFAHNSCARTKHFWELAFHNVILVEAVVVTNRADCCGWELHNFIVEVHPNAHPQRICNTVDRELATGETVYIGCTRFLAGDAVVIRSNNRLNIFTLCEVAVYGKPLCKSNPCKNGAICTKEEYGFRCMCMGYYEGTTCETYNACLSHPCMNGASCTKDGRVFRCSCRENYEGRTCKSYNACLSSPCKNGASCTKDGRGFQCSCKGNYMGKTCEFGRTRQRPTEFEQTVVCRGCSQLRWCSHGVYGVPGAG
ncbi:hypothetical protein LSAT2_016145 [Lamellibrachia satsuma]|nr:hypothetical protein LSAT2_016145 [Lamellibrachia satsuma]